MLDKTLINNACQASAEIELARNSSIEKILPLIGEFKQVVSFGSQANALAQILKERGCQVTSVTDRSGFLQIAEQLYEQVIVADLNHVSIVESLPQASFDVAVFSGVLEQLRDPLKFLQSVRQILKPSGYLVASIQNSTHGAVRLALLQGDIEAAPVEMIDDVHLNLFTRKTIDHLFQKAGFFIETIDQVTFPILFQEQSDTHDFTHEIVERIKQAEDSETLEFIICAFQKDSEDLTTLQEKYTQLIGEKKCLQTELDLNQSQLQALKAELDQTYGQLYQTQTQLRSSRQDFRQVYAQLQQAQTDLRQAEAQLQHSQIEMRQVYEDLNQAQSRRVLSEELDSQLKHLRSQLSNKQQKIESLRNRLEQKQTDLQTAQSRITAMESSKFWKIRNSWLRFKRSFGLSQEDVTPFIIVPPEQNQPVSAKTTPQKLPKANAQSASQPKKQGNVSFNDYDRWMQHNSPSAADLAKMADIAGVLNYKPVISVIVPTFNTPEKFLREAIESVIAQIYPHWELCIADDASTQPHVRQVLEEFAAKDERIKVTFRQENGHISQCSNSALALATGDYIALLDHDDALPPEALYEVAFLLNLHPEADMIYSDEDKLDANGKRCHPYFKPDWCPDNFLSRMYTCHLGVYRRSIVNQIGGFRVGYEGSQDYDLVLRFTEKTDSIFHIPKILYHWRIHEGSVTSGSSAKPYAYEAGKRALLDALQRRGEVGEVISSSKLAGIYTIRYEIKSPDLVSIIIPTKNYGHLLNQCLESIFTKSTYPNFEVVIIDNGSTEAYTEKVINDWLNREPQRVSCYSLGIPFNYSKINNYAVTKAKGKYLLFLNNDTEVIAPDWIEGMVEQAQRPSIGAVGALLLYPDDTVQHAGVVMGMYGFAGHSHKHFSADSLGYSGQLIATSNYSAVTGACFMCKREVFEAVGGFDEALAVACNDVELCLRMLSKGWRNVYLPHVVLYHHESKSRGYEDTPEKKARFVKEMEYVIQRWKPFIEHDPCYNPNLTRDRDDFSLREPKNTELDDCKKQLRQIQKQLKKTQSQLDQIQQEKEEAVGRIAAMETSKFWKLRTRWFRVKRLLLNSSIE